MYARTVRMQLKPNSVAACTRTLANTIMPLLRTQPGFQDEIAFVVPGGTAAVSISVWDHKEQADTYHRSTYPAVLRANRAITSFTLVGSSCDFTLSTPTQRVTTLRKRTKRPRVLTSPHLIYEDLCQSPTVG